MPWTAGALLAVQGVLPSIRFHVCNWERGVSLTLGQPGVAEPCSDIGIDDIGICVGNSSDVVMPEEHSG